jgi:hypothetical protein
MKTKPWRIREQSDRPGFFSFFGYFFSFLSKKKRKKVTKKFEIKEKLQLKKEELNYKNQNQKKPHKLLPIENI